MIDICTAGRSLALNPDTGTSNGDAEAGPERDKFAIVVIPRLIQSSTRPQLHADHYENYLYRIALDTVPPSFCACIPVAGVRMCRPDSDK